MTADTAPRTWPETWPENIVVDVTELDLIADLDPGSLVWTPTPDRVSV